MFATAMDPLRRPGGLDFGQTTVPEQLRAMELAIGIDRDLQHVPPAETLFLHRKIGGMYLQATELRARVELHSLAQRYR